MKRLLTILFAIIAIGSVYINIQERQGNIIIAQAVTCIDTTMVPSSTYKVYDNTAEPFNTSIFSRINPALVITLSVNTASGVKGGFCCPSTSPELWYLTRPDDPFRNDEIGSNINNYVCCPSPAGSDKNQVAYFDNGDIFCAVYDTSGNTVINFNSIGVRADNSKETVDFVAGGGNLDSSPGAGNNSAVIGCGETVTSPGSCPSVCPMDFFYDCDGSILYSFCKSDGAPDTSCTQQSPKVLSAYGSSCVPQYASCADVPNGINFMEGIENGHFNLTGWIMTPDAVKLDIQRKLKANSLRLCINQNVTELISYRAARIRSPDNPRTIYHNADNDTYLRGCAPGRVGSKAPVAGNVLGSWELAGCCLPGYQYVTDANLLSGNGVEYQNRGICCGIPSGTTPGDPLYPYSRNGDSCQARDGTILDSLSSPVDNSSEIAGYDLGLTTFDGTDNLLIDNNGVNNLCPINHNDCVIIGTDTTTKLPAVTDPALLASDDKLACYRCYANGEAIHVDPVGQKLYLCNNGNLQEQNLINNSVASTLAYLRERDVTGAENADALESCLTRGGLYVAIGCIDPTPLGVITGLIRIAFGIMGGVSLIQLIVAGIAYQSGDEAKIQEAREKVISTITGVALLVFSVLILRIIGINVLDVVPVGSF
jgi:hypothetical protein